VNSTSVSEERRAVSVLAEVRGSVGRELSPTGSAANDAVQFDAVVSAVSVGCFRFIGLKEPVVSDKTPPRELTSAVEPRFFRGSRAQQRL